MLKLTNNANNICVHERLKYEAYFYMVLLPFTLYFNFTLLLINKKEEKSRIWLLLVALI